MCISFLLPFSATFSVTDQPLASGFILLYPLKFMISLPLTSLLDYSFHPFQEHLSHYYLSLRSVFMLFHLL